MSCLADDGQATAGKKRARLESAGRVPHVANDVRAKLELLLSLLAQVGHAHTQLQHDTTATCNELIIATAVLAAERVYQGRYVLLIGHACRPTCCSLDRLERSTAGFDA